MADHLPSVPEAWIDIEGWLESNAPIDYHALRGRSLDAEALGRRSGRLVHPQLQEFLTSQGGADDVPPAPQNLEIGTKTGLIPGFRIMSREEIETFHIGSSRDDALMNWTPFAANDWGACLVVDSSSGPDFGSVRLVDVWATVDGDICWPELVVLLRGLRAALVNGEVLVFGGLEYVRETLQRGQLLWRQV